LNPQGNLLLTIDEDGRAILTNFPRRISIYHFSFKSVVSALSFSPSGRHFAVGVGRIVEIWHTPSTPDTVADGELEFAPFVLHRRLAGHFDTVQSIHWSSDSRFFLTSSKDLTARVWSVDPEEGFEPTTLAGHKESVKNAWFSKDQETVRTRPVPLLQTLIKNTDLHGLARWCIVSMAICQEVIRREDE
jgi:periodic tryptophan protein 2